MVKDFEALEQEYGNFYAPAFSILVDEKEIKPLGAEVAGVTVDNVIEGGADQFSFSVNNPFNPSKSEFKWSENGFFDVGKKVEIKMGYGSKLEPLLRGLITTVRLSFPAGGSSQLEIAGYSLMHLMMKGKKSRSWDNKKDSDVVSIIARGSEYEFKTSGIEDSLVSHPKIKQDKQSDYDFIKKLAEEINGFEFFVFEDKLYFRKPAKDAGPLVKLSWGKTLFSFSPEINIAEQVTEVKVIGWDPSSKKEIIGKASKGDEDKKGKGESGSEQAGKIYEKVVEEVRKPVYNQAEADRLAKAILNKKSEGFVKGTGECIGLPFLRPGYTIELEGLGRKFSRKYYIEKTTHSIGASGYKTTFGVKDNSI